MSQSATIFNLKIFFFYCLYYDFNFNKISFRKITSRGAFFLAFAEGFSFRLHLCSPSDPNKSVDPKMFWPPISLCQISYFCRWYRFYQSFYFCHSYILEFLQYCILLIYQYCILHYHILAFLHSCILILLISCILEFLDSGSV